MVKNLCILNNEEEIKEILKGIAPLLRNKKRSILLMGGNYEEVNMETQKEIVTYMSTMPKETKKSARTKEISPTMAAVSPSHSYEKPAETSNPSDSPHITIDSESMQVDNTDITVDRTKDPFKYFGSSIVGNIVDYINSFDEEKEQHKKKEDVPFEKKIKSMLTSTEATTISAPTATVIVKPASQETMVTTTIVQSYNKDEAWNLIYSLSKFLEKKKLVKSIEKNLTSILERLEKMVIPIDTSAYIQQ